MTPDQQSRLTAKQTNESIKLTATLTNNLAAGLFIGGIIAPNAAGLLLSPVWYGCLIRAAFGLHIAGKLLLSTLKNED